MKRFFSTFDALTWPFKPTRDEPHFAQYESRLPSLQNAIDAVPGWSTKFPDECAVDAGGVPLFQDDRIAWAIACFGDMTDRRVLELGPLEAGHTYMLEAAGARVTAIEANKPAFLRCLISKEIMGLVKAKFLLGDFVKWLEHGAQHYDLIVASGVLYHMRDPLRLLNAIARKTDQLYLWTVCVTDDHIPVSETRMFNSIPVRLYLQSYANVEKNADFSGGMLERHYWMHKDDILAVLKALGFTDLRLAHEEPHHIFGPCFSVFATKPNLAITLKLPSISAGPFSEGHAS